MKKLFTLALILSGSAAFAQAAADSTDTSSVTVEKPEFDKGQFSKIIGGAEIINPGYFDNGYEIDRDFKNSLIGKLTSNAFIAYNLDEKYDSELKQKMFRASADYKQLEQKLVNDKAILKNKRFYYTVKNWTGEPFKYNLTTKSFTFKMPQDCHDLNKVGAIQLSGICIPVLVGVSVKNQSLTYGRSCSVNQIITYKVTDPQKALKIEENEENLLFSYVFKFASAQRYSNQIVGNQIKREGWHLFAKPEQIIIHDRETGEVYQVFDVVQVPQGTAKPSARK